MSGPDPPHRRPQAPRINTGPYGSRASASTSTTTYTNSPSTANVRHSAAHAPARPDSMNARKRPEGPRSRGNSPPDKRVRPEPGMSTQGRRSTDRPSPIPTSASSSRKGSVASTVSRKASIPGPSDNVPTGPGRANKDDPSKSSSTKASNGMSRMQDHSSARRSSLGNSPLHAQSPASGSGNSTPLHVAPPAPSMLPKATVNVQSSSSTTSPGQGITLASLQNLKLRKQAIANEMKGKSGETTSSLTSAAKLAAQQMEINQLKKEREQMSQKLQALESLPRQFEELKSRINDAPDQSVSIRDALRCVEDLEKLKALPDRVSGLEVKLTKQAKNDSYANLENDIKEIKNWRATEAASRHEVNEKTKTSILRELDTKVERAQEKMKVELKTTTAQYNKRVQGVTDDFQALKLDSSSLKTFKQNFERQNVFSKLQKLSQDVENIKAKQEDDHVTIADDIHRYIGPIRKEFDINQKSLLDRVKNQGMIIRQITEFQSELENPCEKEGKLTMRQAQAKARLNVLEEHANSSAVPRAANNEAREQGQELWRRSKDVQESATQLAQIQGQQRRVDEHSEEFKVLKSRIESMDNRLTVLADQVKPLDLATADLRKVQDEVVTYAALDAKLQDLQTQVQHQTSQALKSFRANLSNTYDEMINEINKNIDGLDEGLVTVESTVVNQTGEIQALQMEVPELFNSTLDPFKEQMEQQVEQLTQGVDKMREDVKELKQRPSQVQEPPTIQQILDSDGIRHLKEDINRLSSMLTPDVNGTKNVTEEVSRLVIKIEAYERGIEKVKNELAAKADSTSTHQRFDQFTMIVRGLQDQYNNITTEDLHGRMVHWFLQHYPSNAANMLHQFASIQQEIKGLNALSAQVAWLQSRSQDLSMLLQDAPRLQELAQTIDDLQQQLPQKWSMVDQAFNRSSEAISRLDGQTEANKNMNGSLKDLQQKLRDLSSTNSPFAKIQAIRDLEKSISDLRSYIDQSIDIEREACVNGRNELRHAASIEHDARLTKIQKLKSDMEGWTATTKDLTARVNNILQTSDKLRREVDTINGEFVEPNKITFGMFRTMLLVVGQIQYIIECVNQNLHKGPLEIDWIHAFHDFSNPEWQEGEAQESSAKGKEKSKQ